MKKKAKTKERKARRKEEKEERNSIRKIKGKEMISNEENLKWKKKNKKLKITKKKLTTSVLAAAIVDVGVHHPAVADVVLVMTPTPVATGMDPLPANPAELDKSPTSIRCSLISRCKPFAPVPRAVCSVFDVATQHFRACLTRSDVVGYFFAHRGFSRSSG